ncbi:MAG TPA: ECF-type sigma factor [Gemmataceae bacterium]|jgi:RNA polymerase sigma factor (TIGR02999 family)
MNDVTQLLNAIEHGDPHAADRLLPLVYDELRRLATRKLKSEAPGQTLQATALVHEAYLRLVGAGDEPRWHSRGHFFAAAAEAMRRILVENVRRKRSLKQGGGRTREEFDEVQLAAPEPIEDLLALDEALDKLASNDPVKAELVKLRYFAGMTIEETAAALDISTATAKRYWTYARTWLFQEIAGEAKNPPRA